MSWWNISSFFKKTPTKAPLVTTVSVVPSVETHLVSNQTPSIETKPNIQSIPQVPQKLWTNDFENFIVKFLFQWECNFQHGHWGDLDYVIPEDVEDDDGGLTKWGVDISGNSDFLKQQYGLSGEDAINYIKNLTKNQALEIYWLNNYKQSLCHTLTGNLQWAYLDCHVNAGPTRAKQFLSATTAKEYNDLRRSFYHRLVDSKPSNQKFLAGWLNRVDALDKFLNIS